MKSSTTVLQSVIYIPAASTSCASTTIVPIAKLQVLDQLRLPHEMIYIDVPDVATTWQVIHKMQIRGAPLIAVVACLGLAVDLQHRFPFTTKNNTSMNPTTNIVQPQEEEEEFTEEVVYQYIQQKMEYLLTSRPTAVNLFNALQELQQAVTAVQQQQQPMVELNTNISRDKAKLYIQTVVQHAEFMLQRDESDCRALGQHGAETIVQRFTTDTTTTTPTKKITVLTICNTGSLATAAYGTALGIVRSLRSAGQLEAVVALETRPYNQGSRLTAFELLQDQLPGATLICDSMAAAYMQLHTQTDSKNRNMVCVVGADRVAANGDTANKIGTYGLAVTAAAHHIDFYVAAPLTTMDITLPNGTVIPIEERPAEELLRTSHAPSNMPVWNPAFDVTPARYIAGIVTEKGVIRPNANGEFDIPAFIAQHTGERVSDVPDNTSTGTIQVPVSYHEQNIQSLPQYIADNIVDVMQALGASTADDLDCVEMGDGNLNLVFIVSNKKNKKADAKKVIIKQALPYVRCVGESWPLTLDRAYFEYSALQAEKEACPEFVPTLYYFSREDALMVMEYLAPPNIILRKGLIQGIHYPTMAADLGTFCAKTLFATSGFQLSASELRKKVHFWSQNYEMCALTEQVVFTEPYIQAANNRWTSPQLDSDKKEIENDNALKLAVSQWKQKFVTQTQALIHADLHTGSVMCSPLDRQTFVIDPEFAFMGPAAFDTGALIANLFLSYVSQIGHQSNDDYAEWILQQIVTFWNTFVCHFVSMWNDPLQHTGFVYSRDVLGDDVVACQKVHMKSMLTDTLGFAGTKMLRRIVGIAHVEDLESISNVEVRAQCERRGLAIAKTFIKTASAFETIEDAVKFAREISVE